MSISHRLLVPASGDTDNQLLQKVLQRLSEGVDISAIDGRIGDVSKDLVVASSEVTRPADTTPYSVGDVVGSLLSWDVVRIAGENGVAVGARLVKNSTTSTNAQFRLILFNQSVSVASDNSAFVLAYANVAKTLGYLDFTSFIAGGSGSDSLEAAGDFPNGNLKVTTATTTVYGVLVALAGYIPTASEKFTVELTVERN